MVVVLFLCKGTHEATGNMGTKIERWYYRYAVLFYPKKYKYEIEGIPGVAEDFQVK